MSDYTQIEDYSAKDALTSGDPEKVISGADIDAELAAIATAIATKVNNTGNETVAGNKTFSGNNIHSGTNTFDNLVTFEKGADIASATTVNLTAATGNLVHITGTTTTTGFTMNTGQVMDLIADAAWPLTYNATTCKINGGVSRTCAAGDRLRVFYDGATTYVNVVKQDGTAVVGSSVAGQVIQVKEGTPYSTYSSSTAAFPRDDTVPQNTEGTEIINDCTITPASATNRLKIYAQVMGLANTSGPLQAAAAIFQDSTADALAVGVADMASADWACTDLFFTHEMAAGTTSATTFKLRWSANTAGTTYINGINTGRLYGGKMACRLWVEEIKV